MHDSSKIDMQRFAKLVMLVTAVFIIFVIIVYTFAYSPPKPNLSNPYSMTQWPTAEAQMQYELHSYRSIQVNPETGQQVAPDATPETVETRYTVPISVAKEVVLQQNMIQTREVTPTN
jgi:hypothetical protein